MNGYPQACPPGNPTTNLQYDGLDRQISHSDNLPGDQTVLSHYDGLGRNLFYDHQNSSAVDVAYSLDDLGHPRALVQYNSGGYYGDEYLFDDGKSNITTSLNSSGNPNCQVLYDPFGQPRRPAGQTNPCTTGSTADAIFYRGGRRDAAAGDYPLGARTYDPTKGSFLQPDTFRTGQPKQDIAIGVDPLTRDRYLYGASDPVNHVDRSGHCGCPMNPDAGAQGPDGSDFSSSDTSGSGSGNGSEPPTDDMKPKPGGGATMYSPAAAEAAQAGHERPAPAGPSSPQGPGTSSTADVRDSHTQPQQKLDMLGWWWWYVNNVERPMGDAEWSALKWLSDPQNVGPIAVFDNPVADYEMVEPAVQEGLATFDQLPLFVQTPRGIAMQETSADALAARDAVLRGATLFKGAGRGVSHPSSLSSLLSRIRIRWSLPSAMESQMPTFLLDGSLRVDLSPVPTSSQGLLQVQAAIPAEP